MCEYGNTGQDVRGQAMRGATRPRTKQMTRTQPTVARQQQTQTPKQNRHDGSHSPAHPTRPILLKSETASAPTPAAPRTRKLLPRGVLADQRREGGVGRPQRVAQPRQQPVPGAVRAHGGETQTAGSHDLRAGMGCERGQQTQWRTKDSGCIWQKGRDGLVEAGRRL